MKPQNELALIVGYYLSRLDKEGYLLLGFKTFAEAIEKIQEVLRVKKNTIKNMRDEFDPYHRNNRIGWKRELRGSRLIVLEAFQNIDDSVLLEIVKEILCNKEFRDTEEYRNIHTLFLKGVGYFKNKSSRTKSVFVLRGPTGKAAESFFLESFRNKSLAITGTIVDSRDLGCGYDFEIKNNSRSYFIEVKGLAMAEGGVLLTNKEWQTALKYGEEYYLAVVKNLSTKPNIEMIHNPALNLRPKRNIYTTIQVNWIISKI
jgi:hypothetical protein